MTPPLSEKQQQAWELHQTMSLREVARVMGISPDAVNSHLKRARRKRAKRHKGAG
jgi:DNA-directed RNA polymerase specialized sigma24 family protein